MSVLGAPTNVSGPPGGERNFILQGISSAFAREYSHHRPSAMTMRFCSSGSTMEACSAQNNGAAGPINMVLPDPDARTIDATRSEASRIVGDSDAVNHRRGRDASNSEAVTLPNLPKSAGWNAMAPDPIDMNDWL